MIPGNDDAIRSIRLYVQIAAESVLEGRASVPLVESNEEFVELDADGNPIKTKAEKPKPDARKATKKKVTKKVVARKPLVAEAAEELDEFAELTAAVEADATEAAEAVEELEATAEKKVTRKKTSKKKVDEDGAD
jgi:small subunit ribosomal protein S2